MERDDRDFVCVQCGQGFRFSNGERDFYLQNQLQLPKRCRNCRGGARRGAQGPSRDAAPARGSLTRHELNRGPSGQGNGNGQGGGRGPRRAQPGAATWRSAAYDDPNGYRSPAFQDASRAYRIDYAGLPKDDDEQPGDSAGNSTGPAHFHAQTPRAQSQGNAHPRGMNGRRPDRQGTDPDAYRSPGFRGDDRKSRGWGARGDARKSPATPAAADDAQNHETAHDAPGEGQTDTLGANSEARTPSRRERRSQRPRYETSCVECGAPAVVPFQPGPDRPAFCKPCYQIKKPELGLGPGKTPKFPLGADASESATESAPEAPVAPPVSEPAATAEST